MEKKNKQLYKMSENTKIILEIIAILIIFGTIIVASHNPTINLNGIELKKQTYDSINKLFNNSDFQICKIADGSCLRFRRLR